MGVLTLDKLEKFKNGALGVTRNGLKAKFVNQEDEMSTAVVVVFKGNDFRFENYSALPYYQSNGDDDLDIISLWEDKPEPFNLERALAGEPLIDLHNNEKCWVYKSHKDGSLFIEYENTYSHLENINPLEYLGNVKELSKCFAMWKEPEPINSSDNELPKPIKDFGGLKVVWYIQKVDHQYKPYTSYNSGGWLDHQAQSLNNGCYYATKEDCKKVCDWLMNR